MIDLKHFPSAANGGQAWYLSAAAVLKEGEDRERKQGGKGKKIEEQNSSFSYEDLPSNLLGTYFGIWLESTDTKGCDFIDLLQQFLTLLGVTENPLSEAPNAKQMEKDANEEAGLHDDNPNNNGYRTKTKNHSYQPVFTTEPLNCDGIDKDICDFLVRARHFGINVTVK